MCTCIDKTIANDIHTFLKCVPQEEQLIMSGSPSIVSLLEALSGKYPGATALVNRLHIHMCSDGFFTCPFHGR